MIYFILCNQKLPIIDIMLTFFLENIFRKSLNDSFIILLSNVLFLMITLYLMDSLLMSYLFTLTLLVIIHLF